MLFRGAVQFVLAAAKCRMRFHNKLRNIDEISCEPYSVAGCSAFKTLNSSTIVIQNGRQPLLCLLQWHALTGGIIRHLILADLADGKIR